MREGRIRLVLDCLSTLAITLAAVIIGWRAVTDARPTRSEPSRAIGPGSWEAIGGLETVSPVPNGKSLKSKVALLEFSDFQCPFCNRYATLVYPELEREFVQNGKVEYVFRNFPLEAIHTRAFRAAEAATCAADQGHLLEMRHQLFLNSRALEDTDLMNRARELKLDAKVFSNCLNGAVAARIRQDIAEGQKLGITGTPTFMIGEMSPKGRITLTKRLQGLPSYSTLKTAVEEALKRQSATAG